MDYLSKGVRRFLAVVVLVLVALALPVFGADAWGRLLVAWGVPLNWQVYSIAWLLALGVGLLVGWLSHIATRASKRKKSTA